MDNIQRQAEAVTRTLGRINAMYSRWAADRGVDYSQSKVLMALHVNGAQPQRRIVEEHAMPKQSVHNVVRSLQEQGLVELQVAPDDRRQKVVALTESGTQRATELLQPAFDLDARIIARLGLDRHQQLLQALQWYEQAFEVEVAATTIDQRPQ